MLGWADVFFVSSAVCDLDRSRQIGSVHAHFQEGELKRGERDRKIWLVLNIGVHSKVFEWEDILKSLCLPSLKGTFSVVLLSLIFDNLTVYILSILLHLSLFQKRDWAKSVVLASQDILSAV